MFEVGSKLSKLKGPLSPCMRLPKSLQLLKFLSFCMLQNMSSTYGSMPCAYIATSKLDCFLSQHFLSSGIYQTQFGLAPFPQKYDTFSNNWNFDVNPILYSFFPKGTMCDVFLTIAVTHLKIYVTSFV